MGELTSAQFSEWEAFDRINPIGEERDDFRMAYIISTITNIAIGIHGKKGAQMTTPSDFMPDWSGEGKYKNKGQTVEEMKQILLSIAGSQNKKVAKEKKMAGIHSRKTKDK